MGKLLRVKRPHQEDCLPVGGLTATHVDDAGDFYAKMHLEQDMEEEDVDQADGR